MTHLSKKGERVKGSYRNDLTILQTISIRTGNRRGAPPSEVVAPEEERKNNGGRVCKKGNGSNTAPKSPIRAAVATDLEKSRYPGRETKEEALAVSLRYEDGEL